MRKVKSRFLATLLIIIMLSGMVSFTVGASAQEINIDGLSTPAIYAAFNAARDSAGAGGTVNVTGSATIATTLTLQILDNMTVNWQATLSGAYNGALINISGNGTFNISDTINNNGSGPNSTTITVSGPSTTINVEGGGTVSKGGITGNALLVSANNVAINVAAGGTIKSLSTNTYAALQIGVGVSEVMITSSGSIISEEAGSGIYNSGTNTVITINDGLVQAGSGSAIRSAGVASVTVTGGVVQNSARNNVTPTIYIDAAGDVLVSGTAVVQSLESYGFTIQTKGNVYVSDDANVRANNGRAINLVGESSVATIDGNATVSATGTGAAISTATTDPGTVTNAGVVIKSGTVSAANGNAIQITGANSYVDVIGGTVTTERGNAIQVGISGTQPATNASVVVSGGTVQATGGVSNSYAIRAWGTSSHIRVTDFLRNDNIGDIDRGGQVAVFRTGAAINTTGSVKVEGGFVFAYGTTPATAITVGGGLEGPEPDHGVVVVWNPARTAYQIGTSDDLTPTVGVTTWGVDEAGRPGIDYVNTGPGTTQGFFPLAGVEPLYNSLTVVDPVPGGKTEGDATGIYLVGKRISVSAEADDGWHFTGWNITGGAVLEDHRLSKLATFIMPNSPVTLEATFEANPAEHYALNVFGNIGGRVSGTLSGPYRAGEVISVIAEANDGWHFIGWTVDGGVELEGGILAKPAVFNMPANAVTITANFEPNPVERYTLNVIGGVGGAVSGTNSGAYPAGHAVSVTAEANDGWHFTGWTIDGVVLERGAFAKPAIFDMPAGAVTITANFDQNPAEHYTLNVIGCVNGIVTGTRSGAYRAGYAVSVTAVANDGWRFSHWTIDGAVITGGNTANPAVFNMPANAVTIRANFVPVPVQAAPATGDNRNLILPIVMLALGLLTVTGAEIYRRGKKKASKK